LENYTAWIPAGNGNIESPRIKSDHAMSFGRIVGRLKSALISV
jgi:hypothetical protein